MTKKAVFQRFERVDRDHHATAHTRSETNPRHPWRDRHTGLSPKTGSRRIQCKLRQPTLHHRARREKENYSLPEHLGILWVLLDHAEMPTSIISHHRLVSVVRSRNLDSLFPVVCPCGPDVLHPGSDKSWRRGIKSARLTTGQRFGCVRSRGRRFQR
jgi:hypothetical protein